MPLTRQLNYIFEIDYLKNSNEMDIARYSQWHFSNMLNLNFKKFPKLNFKIDLDYYMKDPVLSDNIKIMILGTELSYIF